MYYYFWGQSRVLFGLFVPLEGTPPGPCFKLARTGSPCTSTPGPQSWGLAEPEETTLPRGAWLPRRHMATPGPCASGGARPYSAGPLLGPLQTAFFGTRTGAERGFGARRALFRGGTSSCTPRRRSSAQPRERTQRTHSVGCSKSDSSPELLRLSTTCVAARCKGGPVPCACPKAMPPARDPRRGPVSRGRRTAMGGWGGSMHIGRLGAAVLVACALICHGADFMGGKIR